MRLGERDIGRNAELRVFQFRFAEVADINAEALIADAGADLSGLRHRVEALAEAHPLYPAVQDLAAAKTA